MLFLMTHAAAVQPVLSWMAAATAGEAAHSAARKMAVHAQTPTSHRASAVGTQARRQQDPRPTQHLWLVVAAVKAQPVEERA